MGDAVDKGNMRSMQSLKCLVPTLRVSVFDDLLK